MPIWIDDSHLDAAWLCSKSDAISSTSSNVVVSVQDISNQGRLGSTPQQGGTLLLTLVEGNDETKNKKKLVLKQIPESQAALSRQLGLAREALFYEQLAPHLWKDDSSSSLPRIYYAYGDLETGEKCIVMEHLASSNWVDSGIFFGPGNPNNWSRNLPQQLQAAYGDQPVPTAADVAKATFQAMAQTHAAFWRNNLLLDPSHNWLRGHAWLQGRGREWWEAAQALIQGIWKEYTTATIKPNEEDATPTTYIKWDTTVRQAVETAVRGISWQAQQDRLRVDGRWTLVHGDFWPGNVMWNVKQDSNSNISNNNRLRLLDWEMVGLGSGPQDLGQYVLSNFDPVERRACERDLVQTYYNELVRCGVKDDEQLWDYVWSEYKVGGVERWLWFLIYFVGQPGMTDWAQFFHDQIAAFMNDHSMTAVDITQPRP